MNWLRCGKTKSGSIGMDGRCNVSRRLKRWQSKQASPPSAVPLKVLFPLLDGAALEEDETLSTMWAALLANAADPKNTEHVRPSFVEALKHLSRSEALLLNGLYDVSRREYQKLYVDNLDLAERGQVSSARQLSDPSSRFIDFVVGAGDVVAPTNMDLREEVWTAMGNETMVDRNEPSWTQYTICMDTLLMERLIEIRAGGGLVFTSRGLEFLAMCRTPSKADSR